MTRSLYSDDHEQLRSLLIEARESSALSQYDLAEKLKRPQSFVSKYERGERRLDVIEFIEVCEAIGVNPLTLLKGLNSITGEIDDTQPIAEAATNNILDLWEVTPQELSILIDENPSLRGMVLGYVAELKFTELWLRDESITAFFKHDDHNREGKGDRVVTYKGEEFIIEVKSLQTKTVKQVGDYKVGQAQVDGSDKREIVFADGTKFTTTLLLRGQFDILAVNIFAFENKWRFVFAKNSDLPTSTFSKYTPAQQAALIKSMVSVTWPVEKPFYESPYEILEELYQERMKAREIKA